MLVTALELGMSVHEFRLMPFMAIRNLLGASYDRSMRGRANGAPGVRDATQDDIDGF